MVCKSIGLEASEGLTLMINLVLFIFLSFMELVLRPDLFQSVAFVVIRPAYF